MEKIAKITSLTPLGTTHHLLFLLRNLGMSHLKLAPQRYASMRAGVMISALCFFSMGCVEAAEPQTQVRQGLAGKYRGDRGIENDPNVIFVEDFEEGSLDAVASGWEGLIRAGF